MRKRVDSHTDSVWHQKAQAQSDSKAFERFCRLPAIPWLCFQLGQDGLLYNLLSRWSYSASASQEIDK